MSNRESKKFALLSLAGVVLVVLFVTSAAGVSYSAMISSVTNTNNSLSFIHTQSHVEPDPNTDTEELIEPLYPYDIEIEVDGESLTLTSYDITPLINLDHKQEISFNLNGKFCIFLNVSKRTTFSINDKGFEIKGQQIPAQGYYTIDNGDNLLKAEGDTYEKQLQYIAENGLWIDPNSDEPVTFAFHQHDTNAGSTPLRLVFAPTGT